MSETEYDDVFEFAKSERDDVRKMAFQGIAEHSRDNESLNRYIRSHPDVAVDVLMGKYSVQHLAVLGDVLTTLTNVAADSAVAELLVAKKVVTRTMRLLDTLDASDEPAAVPLKELVLLLLNNLTASHVTAVDDLLQLQDEDLKGFYLSKLCVFFDRQPADAPRDLRKWVLQIVLNITRVPEAQIALMQDDEWVLNITSLLACENSVHRMLVAQALRNCSNSKDTHPYIVKSGALPIMIARLQQNEEVVEGIAVLIAESVAGLLQTPEGIDAMEGINAKKHLQEGIAAGKISGVVATLIQEQVLPFLDDLVDAYVVER